MNSDHDEGDHQRAACKRRAAADAAAEAAGGLAGRAGADDEPAEPGLRPAGRRPDVDAAARRGAADRLGRRRARPAAAESDAASR